jgi:hypothetical protein
MILVDQSRDIMNISTKCIPALLFFVCAINNSGLAQTNRMSLYLAEDRSGYLLPSLGDNGLLLTPDLAVARLNGAVMEIPFTVKNNSDKDIEFEQDGWNYIAGLAIVDQDGKTRFIADFLSGLEGSRAAGETYSGPGPGWIVLKPGETSSLCSSASSVDMLGEVTGSRIFGVVLARIAGTKKIFVSYSAPFLVPQALTPEPWNDLGRQDYLSITPDLMNANFWDEKLPKGTVKGHNVLTYADLIKSGGEEWLEIPFIPLKVKNLSNQDVIVTINCACFYIAGDEAFRGERMRSMGSNYLHASKRLLKPGESISNKSTGSDVLFVLGRPEHKGYKPGDKIVVVVGGRIPGTNNVFECYSAPFELPLLPKGDTPPAGKQ